MKIVVLFFKMAAKMIKINTIIFSYIINSKANYECKDNKNLINKCSFSSVFLTFITCKEGTLSLDNGIK